MKGPLDPKKGWTQLSVSPSGTLVAYMFSSVTIFEGTLISHELPNAILSVLTGRSVVQHGARRLTQSDSSN